VLRVAAWFGILIALYLIVLADADAQTQTPLSPASSTPGGSWSGLQTGATGGNSSLAQNFAEPGAHLCTITGLGPISPGCIESHLVFTGGLNSPTFGGFLGYRMQFGIAVLGIEADIAWKHVSASAAKTVSYTDFFGFNHTEQFQGSMRQGWDTSLRARAGLLLTPSLLAYGTAGLALGQVCDSFKYSATIIDPESGLFAAASGSGASCDYRPGYTAGGGLEMIVGDGLKARLEYRFTDLGSFSTDVPLAVTFGPGCSAIFACTGNARIDMSAAFQTVRLGIGVDF
jgi:outer membrane immunogenic protein